ncbi:hypothetical protein Pse7367_1761 [Thalassoporum mexicanum PCC 7367]|uniref:chlorophyll a/b-binding protein n=1 Tax=Thalassoporum mexicanum TaxID=3457544 RepID=UPI00029FA569|nr:chlorophyll a/b-binding protein [Pseudanabaena sp. PCC 7367]AFY70039.1 hypothetical protein Pse7367_1761 [Pseudanabaena sp. PCC 7367]
MTTDKIDLDNINVNPSGKGVFGFSNFAEVWNGRMAMLGVVAGFAGEALTGKGILEQVGISTQGGGIMAALFLTGFTAAAMIGYYAVKMSSQLDASNPTEVSESAS